MGSEPRTHQSAITQMEAIKPRRGPGRQTASQTKQRNAELLDKALDLFLQHGFERTSIDAIAAAVGMAKRTVYLRYGDKKRLFKASLQRAIEAWIVPIERLRAAETEDLEETLLRIGQILVENILSPAGIRLMRITNAESGRMPEIGQFTHKQGTAPTLAYLKDLLEHRARTERFDLSDPDQAALAFLYLVVGGPASMTAWGITLAPSEVDRHTRYCVRLFMHGLLHMKAGATQRKTTKGHRDDASTAASAANAHDVLALQEENRRLKMLLAESMLEVARLSEAERDRRPEN